MSAVVPDETLVTFCHAVYQLVLAMTGLKDDLLLKNQVLHEATQLFEGTHEQGTCHDREKAATIILENLRGENPSPEAIRKAAPDRNKVAA